MGFISPPEMPKHCQECLTPLKKMTILSGAWGSVPMIASWASASTLDKHINSLEALYADLFGQLEALVS